MKKFLYIFPDSIIKRKDNSILLQTVEADDWEKIEKEEFFLDKEIDIPLGEKIYIPLETIDSVFSFGTVRFNSKFIDLLSRNEIILHIFNHFAQYSGSFIPPKQSFSGCILENQFYHYSNYSLRMTIAARLIYGQLDNILTVLKYYNNRNMNLVSEIQSIEKILSSVLSTSSVDELRGLEGIARKCYYSAWRKIIIQPVEFDGRIKNPPNNFLNSLISYGNMVLYSICVSEIHRTKLYSEIGFVHELGDLKQPLCYDLADLFKPIIVDRTIFKLLNKNMIAENDGEIINGFCRLSDKCKKLFIQEINSKLFTTIINRHEDKNMCFKRIIRQECYNLAKHINGEESYKPFKMLW